MTAPRPAPPNPAKTTRLIHFSLGMGLALITIVMLVQRTTGTAPPATSPPVIGLLLAGLGVLPIAISLAVMRQRVPQRASNQSPDDYWRTPAVASAAMLVWALIEGGGLMSVVGYYLTATWTPLGVVAVAILALFLARPSTFE